MNGLNLYKVLFALVVILLETSSCICDNAGADEPVAAGTLGILPHQCAGDNTTAWWNSLAVNGSDPCQLHDQLLKQNIVAGCCAGDNNTPLTGSCGPCTLQTYNIVAACVLCSEIPMEQPPSEDAVRNARSIVTLDAFTKHGGTNALLPASFNAISWVNTSVTNSGFFNVTDAVQIAKTPTRATPLPTSIASATSSAPGSFVASTPAASSTSTSVTTTFSSSSSNKRAAAIAGGTVGAFVFVALIAAGIFMYRRRQRAKLAPSLIEPIPFPVQMAQGPLMRNLDTKSQSELLQTQEISTNNSLPRAHAMIEEGHVSGRNSRNNTRTRPNSPEASDVGVGVESDDEDLRSEKTRPPSYTSH